MHSNVIQRENTPGRVDPPMKGRSFKARNKARGSMCPLIMARSMKAAGATGKRTAKEPLYTKTPPNSKATSKTGRKMAKA